MRRLRIAVPLALAGAAVFLAANAASTPTRGKGPRATPILIGAAISTTGFVAPYDLPPEQAAQIAVDEINRQGGLLGHPLKIVISNARSDINQGAQAADELLDKGASMLIVTCDFDYGGPAALEAQKKNKIAFSTCAASTKFGPQGIGPNAFTMATASPAQAAILAEWAYKVKHWRRAYTLTDTTIDTEKQLCTAFAERWRQLGGQVVGRDTFQQNDASIAAQITRMKRAGTIDVLNLCSYQPGGAKALRQIRAAGIDVPMVSGEDWDGTFWQKAVPNVSNVYFVTYGSIFGDDPDPKVNAIFAQLKKQRHPAPTSHALTGYDVIRAWAIAVRKAKSFDTDKVRAALESFRNVKLITGPTTFTKRDHIQFYRSMRLFEIQRGKDKFVTQYRATKVPIPTR
jgi:branched-chain amino acid transport system substrate-binding protein